MGNFLSMKIPYEHAARRFSIVASLTLLTTVFTAQASEPLTPPIAAVGAASVQAGGKASVPSKTPTVAVNAASAPAGADSAAAQTPHFALLPEVLSPGERLMWGEHGLMRRIGAYPLTEESREKELSLRRTMLTVHQVGGFATLAALVTTVVLGQLTLNGNTDLADYHTTMAAGAITLYFTTAALSLFSPPPMVRRNEWNTISIHKG